MNLKPVRNMSESSKRWYSLNLETPESQISGGQDLSHFWKIIFRDAIVFSLKSLRKPSEFWLYKKFELISMSQKLRATPRSSLPPPEVWSLSNRLHISIYFNDRLVGGTNNFSCVWYSNSEFPMMTWSQWMWGDVAAWFLIYFLVESYMWAIILQNSFKIGMISIAILTLICY